MKQSKQDDVHSVEKLSLLDQRIQQEDEGEVILIEVSQQRRRCRSLGLRLGFTVSAVTFLLLCRRQSKGDRLPIRSPSEMYKLYGQGRDTKRLGTTPDYVEINTYQDKHLRRQENMRQLDSVRFGHCGGFEQFANLSLPDDLLNGDPFEGSNWDVNEDADVAWHCSDGESYNIFQNPSMQNVNAFNKLPCENRVAYRFLCEAPHPVLEDVTVTIERIGPFTGTGGYDWSIVADLENVGRLQSRMNGKDWTFVGGMVAPVSSDGTIISYPPIHIHHAHVFPYGEFDERGEKIIGSVGDHHDIFFQSHGDSECLADEGGIACLLKQLDEGKGFVVHNSTSGISANFEFNDVRPKGSPAMKYWVETAVLHSPNPPKENKATFVGLNNPCFGDGPCTYMFPMDPHNNAMWFQYEHGDPSTQLSAGTISDFVLHTHQTIFDSAFLIKAPNNDLYNSLESYREGKRLPLILDCHHDGVGLNTAKRELLARIDQHDGQLICEATKPSLLFVEGENGELHGRDKRARLNCLKDPVELKPGDRLVVLAFNSVHENRYTRQSQAFKSQNAFSEYFAAYQHTIFRFTLTYDDQVEYTPPSFFYYSDIAEDLDSDDFNPDHYATTTCPSSIRYSMNRGWMSWFGL